MYDKVRTLCDGGSSSLLRHHAAKVGTARGDTARAHVRRSAGPYQSIRERKMAVDGVSGVGSITEKLDWCENC